MKRKQTLVIVDIQPPFSPGPLPVGSPDPEAMAALARLVGTSYEPFSPRETPSMEGWPGPLLPLSWPDQGASPCFDTAEAMRSALQDALHEAKPIVVVAGLAPPCRSFAIDQSMRTALDGVVLPVKDYTKR